MKIPLPSPLLLPYTVYICVCKRKSKWGFGNAGAGCFRWLAVSNLVCLLWAQSVDKLVNLIHSHLLLFIFKQKEKWTAPEFICGRWVPNFTAIHPKLLRCFNSERPKKKKSTSCWWKSWFESISCFWGTTGSYVCVCGFDVTTSGRDNCRFENKNGYYSICYIRIGEYIYRRKRKELYWRLFLMENVFLPVYKFDLTTGSTISALLLLIWLVAARLWSTLIDRWIVQSPAKYFFGKCLPFSTLFPKTISGMVQWQKTFFKRKSQGIITRASRIPPLWIMNVCTQYQFIPIVVEIF